MKFSIMLLVLVTVGAVLADTRNPPMGLKGLTIPKNLNNLPNPWADRRIGVQGISLPEGVTIDQVYIVRSNGTNIPMGVGIRPANVKGPQPQWNFTTSSNKNSRVPSYTQRPTYKTTQPMGWAAPTYRYGWAYPGPNSN